MEMSEDQELQLNELEALCASFDEGHVFYDKGPDLLYAGSITVTIGYLDKPISISATVNGEMKSFVVEALPVVVLNFVLPVDYPSSSSPNFTVEALWITEEMSLLVEEKLYKVCNENAQLPALYHAAMAVAECLKEYCSELEKFNLDDVPCVRNRIYTSDQLIKFVTEGVAKQEDNSFATGCHDCEVCCENKLGRYCVKFFPCGDVFCKECVKSHYRRRLQDCQISPLECLRNGCNSLATQTVIREAIGDEDFERYDDLLLDRSLSQMNDMVICPRVACQMPVILSGLTPNLGVCDLCGFSFCAICKRAYHGLEDCKFSNDQRKELLKEWEESSETVRMSLAMKYGGTQAMMKVIHTLKNETWIDSNSQPCPRCKVSIEKNSGCNKMRCTKCDCNFCWLCGKLLNDDDPYAHFNGEEECFNRLFEGVDEEEDEEWSGEDDISDSDTLSYQSSDSEIDDDTCDGIDFVADRNTDD